MVMQVASSTHHPPPPTTHPTPTQHPTTTIDHHPTPTTRDPHRPPTPNTTCPWCGKIIREIVSIVRLPRLLLLLPIDIFGMKQGPCIGCCIFPSWLPA
mmetsp:Transcript_14000/g.27671  ORF Transcript_14000/g.27671 Transcript_14000/m.27671 type:complete len:98 (+) Transcript_14000:2798-3091(+)